MSNPPALVSADFATSAAIRHGFYGRRGGVSSGDFASLNCSEFCGDARHSVQINRRRVADSLGGHPIFTNQQIHSNRVRSVHAHTDCAEIFAADGLVTREAGLTLGVLSADCAPLLFADPVAPVIGAAHAGWRGALSGITDTMLAAMVQLGAAPNQIQCAIGPAIQFESYRVGQEFFARFQADSPIQCERCFRRAPAAESMASGKLSEADGSNDSGDPGYYFDLPGYLRKRLAHVGITVVHTRADDTCTEARQFFSYRRSCRHGATACGRQISAIVLA